LSDRPVSCCQSSECPAQYQEPTYLSVLLHIESEKSDGGS
jgi:hypothetical protein